MSDNRKYYYLKLKENYFDDDSIVLLESMGSRRMRLRNPMQSRRPQRKADFLLRMKKAALSVA